MGYVLTLWATPRVDRRGQTVLGYSFVDPQGVTVFEGEDFAGSPLHADDSDATLRSLLGFLTLRLGDTDREYFADYNERQVAFRDNEAEMLSLWTDDDGPDFEDIDTLDPVVRFLGEGSEGSNVELGEVER